MSWKVANLCAVRKFGSPVRKQIIMLLADKASDEGSGIYCSKGYIRRHTELGESTVKRTVGELVKDGLLVETGQRRRCKNGYTVIYRLDLVRIDKLEPIAEPPDDTPDLTGSPEDGVPCDAGTGPAPDPVPRPERTPNHPKTIQEPLTRARDIEEVWDAFPEDRRRNKGVTLKEAALAVEEGYEVSELIAAVEIYARESAGFTRSKVSFSDNWFRQRKWVQRVEQLRAEKEEEMARADRHYEQIAKWVKERSWMCAHVTDRQAKEAINRGYLSLEEARSAGVLR